MVDEGADISWLLANNLRAGVFEDAWAVQSRLRFCSDEVLHSLADPPNTRVAFSGRAEQLHDLGSQCWRVEQKPAFIKYRNAWLRRLSCGPRSHRRCDQHAHRSFQARVGAQTFHIEKQPIAVQAHGSLAVKQVRVDAVFSCP